MSNTHTGNVQPAIDYEEHARIGGLDGKKVFIMDNTGNQITSFGGNATVDIRNAVNANVSLGASAQFIGLVSIQGNTNLNSGTNYIGLATVDIGTNNTVKSVVSLSNSIANIGFATVNIANIINATVSLSPSANYIGLASVNIGGALPALSVGAAYVGLMTVDIGTSNSVAIKGNVTLSDSKGFIGLVSIAQPINANISLGASAQFIGIVTVANRDRTITGNVTLSDAKTYIGLTTTTLGVGTTFIGLVTAVTRNAGTNKTLIPKNLNFATSSIVTIAVPTNTFYITQLILNSNATVRLNIKSGATYLTGNASLGININPGGGWVQNGAPDSPVYVGLAAAGAIVLEKFDSSGVVSQIGGHLIYFDE